MGIGSSAARNFGWGRKLEWAGVQALRDRYASGHFSTIAKHAADWRQFTGWLATRGIRDAREINIDHVTAYARHLADQVGQGAMAVKTGQNRLSAVNSVLAHMRQDRKLWASPSAAVGARTDVRTSPPRYLDRAELRPVLDKVTDPRVAAMTALARELGLRFRECAMLDSARALRQASTSGEIAIDRGTKGGRARTVPITCPAQVEALRTAARAQGAAKNLIPAGKTYAQWRGTAYRAFYAAGGEHFHDLRAAYACERYRQLTGRAPPVLRSHGDAGPARDIDRAARRQIAAELGHGREKVSNAYVGGRR